MKPRRKSLWGSASLLAALVAGPVAAVAPPAATSEHHGELQEALLSVTVNGAPTGDPITLLRGAAGSLYAPAEMLVSWRIAHEPSPAFIRDQTRVFLKGFEYVFGSSYVTSYSR